MLHCVALAFFIAFELSKLRELEMLNVSSKNCHFLASGVILGRFSHDGPDLNAGSELPIVLFSIFSSQNHTE